MKIINKILIASIAAIISGLIGYFLAEPNKPDIRLDMQDPVLLDSNQITIYKLINNGNGAGNDIEIRFSDAITKKDVAVMNSPEVFNYLKNNSGFEIPRLRPGESFSFYIKQPENVKTEPRDNIIKAVYSEGRITGLTAGLRLTLIKFESFAKGFFIGLATAIGLMAASFYFREKGQKKTCVST
jgi:hypothetical protein